MKKIRKKLINYTFEFIVIVLGISVSFLLEDYRQNQESKYLSKDLIINLINEISEIEKYLKEREEAFKGDQKLLLALQTEGIKPDGLYQLQKIPRLYGAALFNYRGFSPPVAFYKSLVNDGKIRYLESVDLKKELDLMHNVHFSYIHGNVKDEAIAQRKVIDYFQNHHPKIFINSNDFTENYSYVVSVHEVIQKNDYLKAILYQKSLAISQKVVGFNRYKKSLENLKLILIKERDTH